MPRKQSEVEKSLKHKGFIAGGGDHTYFHYHSIAGKKTAVFTKTSHGSKEISDNLLAKMSRQCGLNRHDFDLLIECPLSRESYELKLIAARRIDSPAA
jgi:predicted RNA binding protein YcfA (HicA-like mRNA interferase family)